MIIDFLGGIYGMPLVVVPKLTSRLGRGTSRGVWRENIVQNPERELWQIVREFLQMSCSFAALAGMISALAGMWRTQLPLIASSLLTCDARGAPEPRRGVAERQHGEPLCRRQAGV